MDALGEINELLTELKTLLDDGTLKSNTYTFTVDDITGKVGISTDATDYKIVGLNSLLNQPLGFEPNTDYTSTGVTRSLISPNHILMSTKRYIKINSDITSNNHYSRDFIEPIGVVVGVVADSHVTGQSSQFRRRPTSVLQVPQ